MSAQPLAAEQASQATSAGGSPVVRRLRARRHEIEEAIFVRSRERVPHSRADAEPAHEQLARAGAASLLDFGLAVLDGAIAEAEPMVDVLERMPLAATDHARLAARTDVSLGVVLRRTVVAHRQLCDFVDAELERGEVLAEPASRRLREALDGLLERLTVTAELRYIRAREEVVRAPLQRRAALVRTLLSGLPTSRHELASLDYDVYASWHLALVATLIRPTALEQLADDARVRVLLVPGRSRTMWAWLGAYGAEPLRACAGAVAGVAAPAGSLAIGAPRSGIEGWRQTHLEAEEALPLAMRTNARVVRYEERPLLAAAVGNETLARWLLDLLAPLRAQGARGAKVCDTLRAYIRAECSRSCAAAATGVSRRTVQAHLAMAEELLGRPLHTCLAELAAALDLLELEGNVGAQAG
jgi:hypothetical protein